MALLTIFEKAGVIVMEIFFLKVKQISFTKSGTVLEATDIRFSKLRIILGEMDMFLEVSKGQEIGMPHT